MKGKRSRNRYERRPFKMLRGRILGAPRVISERRGSPAGTSTSSGWTHRTRDGGILFPRIATLGKTAETSGLASLTCETKEWIGWVEMVAESGKVRADVSGKGEGVLGG